MNISENQLYNCCDSIVGFYNEIYFIFIIENFTYMRDSILLVNLGRGKLRMFYKFYNK